MAFIPKAPRVPKININKFDIDSLKSLFLHPSEFLEQEKDLSYRSIVLRYFWFVLAIQIVLFITGFYGYAKSGLEILIIAPIAALLVYVIPALIMPFFSGAITHLGVLIIGNREGFYNTFKPVAYSMFIKTLYMSALALIFQILNIFMPLPASASDSGMGIYFAFAIVFIIAGLIHSFYIRILGIMKYHKMSWWKAFFSALVGPVLLTIYGTFMLLVLDYISIFLG
ncbi:hypothetical protein HN695_01740 [Candidatus Woesearchaeota archaeon]|jgi:hypothetical protein|nr:hypothetical protein [Candidatus Woesearchaeota archaeon]MBT5273122.1 hypothetical protein [Candidatus Woesearchaeota archaeon]MBT6040609.1 hypothetical protein [Candidatus Woesearchaeota archaeon]MBT6337563.1 hypothetical protein [Candidatus Woesearchaeota archaeon]MBT7927036.1 hypothetical protein [Candidatus Woesearchaeota archaeon]